jgi:hypothetical protein
MPRPKTRDNPHPARQVAAGEGPASPVHLKANVKAEGCSGVRCMRIRDHQILMDTPSDFAGYDFRPGSPALQIGVLGSVLTHIFLIQATDREVPLGSLEVVVTAEIN